MNTQVTLTPNETLISEFHDVGARLVHGTGTLALHRPGDTSSDLSRGGVALVQPMPEGVGVTTPPAAAYQAVRADLAYRREVAKIDSSRRSGPELKAEQHIEAAVKAVREVISAEKDIGTYIANPAFGRVRDPAAPVAPPKPKPAPPTNMAGPLAPDSTLPASISDALPANITGLLYPDRSPK